MSNIIDTFPKGTEYPSGGTTGQALVKKTNADNDVEWGTVQAPLTEGDGIDITNDVVSIDAMPAADMSEIITPLPGTMSRRMKYSTDEQVVGEWLDGKPIYQKTIVTTVPATSTEGTAVNSYVPIGASIDTGVDIKGVMKTSEDRYFQVACHPVSNAISGTALLGIRVDIYANGASTANSIQVTSNKASWSGNTLYITIQYTKTTD